MQKIEGVCTECGGDGLRQQVGKVHPMVYREPKSCTHCNGSGMEPVAETDGALTPGEAHYIQETIRNIQETIRNLGTKRKLYNATHTNPS